VWGDRRPAYYVIDARGNAGAIAINRLAAAGLNPSWLTASRDINGFRYEPGSIVVAHSRQAEPAVARAARELGLRVDGVRGRTPAETTPVGRARVALYKPWVESIDEGWTRWLLERYEFKFATLADADVRAGDLRARYDVIIVPSLARDRLVAGHAAGAVPPEYAGGVGAAGVDALRAFVDAGGTLVCLDQAGALAIEAFRLPVRDVANAGGDGFFCPGSILRIDLDPAHPLAYGMRPQTAGFFAFSAAYGLTASNPDGGAGAIRTVARYGAKDLLISGWLEGEATIAGQPAILDAPVGRGRVVLLGFRVQHRAQSHATFRLLFNAIFTATPAKS
jgi:hypothetical protein